MNSALHDACCASYPDETSPTSLVQSFHQKKVSLQFTMIGDKGTGLSPSSRSLCPPRPCLSSLIEFPFSLSHPGKSTMRYRLQQRNFPKRRTDKLSLAVGQSSTESVSFVYETEDYGQVKMRLWDPVCVHKIPFCLSFFFVSSTGNVIFFIYSPHERNLK